MSKFIDLTGKIFGELIVVSRADNYERFSKTHNRILKYARWNCICSCGNPCVVLASDLKSSSQVSCGCFRLEQNIKALTKHGHAKTRTCNSWQSMIYRCSNSKATGWEYYGGRGITVCDRWLSPDGAGFLNFLEDMGERPEGMTLDRIDVNGNYEPSNCRWATYSEQNF